MLAKQWIRDDDSAKTLLLFENSEAAECYFRISTLPGIDLYDHLKKCIQRKLNSYEKQLYENILDISQNEGNNSIVSYPTFVNILNINTYYQKWKEIIFTGDIKSKFVLAGGSVNSLIHNTYNKTAELDFFWLSDKTEELDSMTWQDNQFNEFLHAVTDIHRKFRSKSFATFIMNEGPISIIWNNIPIICKFRIKQ